MTSHQVTIMSSVVRLDQISLIPRSLWPRTLLLSSMFRFLRPSQRSLFGRNGIPRAAVVVAVIVVSHKNGRIYHLMYGMRLLQPPRYLFLYIASSGLTYYQNVHMDRIGYG